MQRLDAGPVTAAQAAAVRQATGVDITGYRRVIDSGDVRHVLKSHGDPAREALRNPPQLAVTKGDFARIGRILDANPVIGGGHRVKGAPTLTYKARIGREEYTLVEQVRRGQRHVALKNLWKRRI